MKVVIISGAGSGFGALSARALADAGNTVYAGIRETAGRNADRVAEARAYAEDNGVDLRVVELDVLSQESVDAGVARIIEGAGGVDAVVHNAGHMVNGPAETFTPEELAAVYDTNVLGTQRLNRAALPHMRRRGHGLLLWVGSASTRGGTPPYIAPYFAAKAAMDSLAVSYAAEVARFGIETTIVVPGVFTSGTEHFANAGRPADEARAAEYEVLYGGISEAVGRRFAELMPADADASWVSEEISRIVALPDGTRPFRSHVDPVDQGSEKVSAVADLARREALTRLGLEDLLRPAARKQVEL